MSTATSRSVSAEAATDERVSAGLVASVVVAFYRVWHGRLRLPGAGFVLRTFTELVAGLQRYPLSVDGVGTVRVDLRDHAGRMLLQHQLGDTFDAFDIEVGLFKALSRVLKPGSVFWDVGANVGTVSSYVATSVAGVRVFAFEPNPDIARSIAQLFVRHPHVKTFPYALSNKDADVVLTIPKGKSVGASIEGLDYVLQTSSLSAKDVDQVTVHAFAGDSLLAREPGVLAPDVVKIDVEGHEAAVLKGLASTIAAHRPVIFFEHLYLSDDDVRGLVPEGYDVFSVSNTDGALTGAFDRSVGHNSILIPIASRA